MTPFDADTTRRVREHEEEPPAGLWARIESTAPPPADPPARRPGWGWGVALLLALSAAVSLLTVEQPTPDSQGRHRDGGGAVTAVAKTGSGAGDDAQAVRRPSGAQARMVSAVAKTGGDAHGGDGGSAAVASAAWVGGEIVVVDEGKPSGAEGATQARNVGGLAASREVAEGVIAADRAAVATAAGEVVPAPPVRDGVDDVALTRARAPVGTWRGSAVGAPALAPVVSTLVVGLRIAPPCAHIPGGGPPSGPQPVGPSWAPQLRASVGVATTRRRSSGPAGESPDYLRLRDTLETGQPDVLAGLAYEQTHVTGLRLRFDVGYQAYHRRATFTGPIVRETTLREVIDPTTNDVTRVDTLARLYRVRSTRQNRHQTLTVGLGAGYAPPTRSVWRPYVLAQAGYEFTVATRGSLLDVDGREVSLDNEDAEWVSPRPGLRLGGTLGVDVAVSPRWLIGVSGRYARTGELSGADDLFSTRGQVFGLGLNASFVMP